MGGAGGQGLPAAVPRGHPQEGGEDADVGKDLEGEGAQDDAAAHGKAHLLPGVEVSIGEPHESGDVAEEVLHYVGPTEGQREGDDSVES